MWPEVTEGERQERSRLPSPPSPTPQPDKKNGPAFGGRSEGAREGGRGRSAVALLCCICILATRCPIRGKGFPRTHVCRVSV